MTRRPKRFSLHPWAPTCEHVLELNKYDWMHYKIEFIDATDLCLCVTVWTGRGAVCAPPLVRQPNLTREQYRIYDCAYCLKNWRQKCYTVWEQYQHVSSWDSSQHELERSCVCVASLQDADIFLQNHNACPERRHQSCVLRWARNQLSVQERVLKRRSGEGSVTGKAIGEGQEMKLLCTWVHFWGEQSQAAGMCPWCQIWLAAEDQYQFPRCQTPLRLPSWLRHQLGWVYVEQDVVTHPGCKRENIVCYFMGVCM
jgi:hypothetical protein